MVIYDIKDKTLSVKGIWTSMFIILKHFLTFFLTFLVPFETSISHVTTPTTTKLLLGTVSVARGKKITQLYKRLI